MSAHHEPKAMEVGPNMRLAGTVGSLVIVVMFAIGMTDRIATWRTLQETHSAVQDEKIAKLAADAIEDRKAAVEDRKLLTDALKLMAASNQRVADADDALRTQLAAFRTSLDKHRGSDR